MTDELIFFWIYFGLIFSFLPLSLCLLLMHFLMPQAVLDRYWKEPHFRPFELMLFSGAPYAPMRTIMFMWMFMFPHLGKKRGIIEPHRLVPRWYRITSIVLCVWAIVILVGGVGGSRVLYIYSISAGGPVGWKEHAALAVAVSGFGFLSVRHWWIKRRGASESSRSQQKKAGVRKQTPSK